MENSGFKDIALEQFKDNFIFEQAKEKFEQYNPKDWGLKLDVYQDISGYVAALSKANESLESMFSYIDKRKKEKMSDGEIYELQEKIEHFKMCFEEDVIFWSEKFDNYLKSDLSTLLVPNSNCEKKTGIILDLIKELTSTMYASISYGYNHFKEKMTRIEESANILALIEGLGDFPKTNDLKKSCSVEMYR